MPHDKIRARAPLRIGLAGGGTDLSPYCDQYGGAVLNATIDLYAYTTIERLSGERLHFVSLDLEKEEELKAVAELPVDQGLLLHRGVYNRMIRQYHSGRPLALRVTTHVDCPYGSGLGSSSALVVSMIEAYRELLHLPLGEYDIAHLAYEIERLDLGLKGGRQDQYAAAFGGVNFMEFNDRNFVIVNPLRIKSSFLNELEASSVLYFTGMSRESSTIIATQVKAMEEKDECSLEGMHQLKRDAVQMKQALLRGEVRRMADILNNSWEAKKRTSDRISNAEIERVYNLALTAGVYAGKVSGAGGGGFMLFLGDPVRRPELVRLLSQLGGQIMIFSFSADGSTAWRV